MGKKRIEVTKEVAAEILRLYLQGKARKDIAEIIGCSPSTVTKYILRSGYTYGKGGRPADYPDDMVAEVKRRRDEGESYASIARSYGLAYSTIYQLYNTQRVASGDVIEFNGSSNTYVFSFDENNTKKCYDEAKDCFYWKGGTCSLCENTIFKNPDGTRAICEHYINKKEKIKLDRIKANVKL